MNGSLVPGRIIPIGTAIRNAKSHGHPGYERISILLSHHCRPRFVHRSRRAPRPQRPRPRFSKTRFARPSEKPQLAGPASQRTHHFTDLFERPIQPEETGLALEQAVLSPRLAHPTRTRWMHSICLTNHCPETDALNSHPPVPGIEPDGSCCRPGRQSPPASPYPES